MNNGNLSTPDYYQLLGVLRTATTAEITAAYYLLARQYHPDVDSAPDALVRFKQITEAYETLSDEQKRRDYDRRYAMSGGLGHRRAPAGAEGAQFRAPRRGRGAAINQGPSPEVMVDVPIAPEEAACGGRCEFTLTLMQRCPACRTFDVKTDAPGLASANCKTCQGLGACETRHAISLALPGGIRDGDTLRLNHQALCRQGPTGEAECNVVLRFRIRPCW